jgi:thymidylate synthase (FAD)
MKVKLISYTTVNPEVFNDLPEELHSTEGLIAYTARVSSPKQDNPDYAKLIAYCVRAKHWSVLEMADMTIEVQCSRAIAAQILRHRSFNFAELSQRYAEVSGYDLYPARRQDLKNRQNSTDDLPEATKRWFDQAQQMLATQAFNLYNTALEKGIAKESARFVLPLSTNTKMYVKGNLRSWVHYLEVRCAPETQKEHRDIALAIKQIFIKQFPIISKALNYVD